MSRVPHSLSILRVGLCSPLGLSAAMTRAEVYAGTLRFQETEVMDSADEPVRASRLSLLPAELSRTERIAALSTQALKDCLAGAGELPNPLPLLLALPEEHGPNAVDGTRVTQAIGAACPDGLTIRTEYIHRGGRAAFWSLLDRAPDYVLRSRTGRVLLGAVDSLVDGGSLRTLARARGHLSELNRDGRLPGEAAAFVLLGPRDKSPGSRLHARVVAWANTSEPRHFSQGEPNLGAGLTLAFRQLSSRSNGRVHRLLSAQPGETFWSRELGQAYLRNAALMPEPFGVEMLAGSLGDVGVASGGVLLELAISDPPRWGGPPDSPRRALLYACADDGAVGASLVEVMA